MATNQTSEPTVLAAVWRYRWFVLFLMFAFAGLGWLYASQTAQWTASATLNVQDPRASNLFDQGAAESPERYVESQVAIIRSRAVAREAVDIAAQQDPPIEVTVTEIVTGLSVTASGRSDIVTISYTAATQREAIGVVNAVAVAYQDIQRQAASATFAEAIRELDVSIGELETELTGYETDLADADQAVLDALATDPSRVAARALLDDLTTQLLELTPPGTGASDGAFARYGNQLSTLNAQIGILRAELDNERTIVVAAAQTSPERQAVVAKQAEAQRRLSELQSRRDQLSVDADLASGGVVFFSPAETAVPSGAGLYVVLGAMVGIALGSVVAVLLASRHSKFEGRNEPEAILGTRLIADVPNFRSERVESLLPVTHAPTSASAEAFRFVAAAISLQQMWPAREDGRQHYTTLMTTSAGLSEGKTIVTANTALAAAREGRRVLVMDADFGNQQLTRLLIGAETTPPVGMTEVAGRNSTLTKAVIEIEHDGSGTVHLLSRGRSPIRAPDFFAAPTTHQMFEDIRNAYDLVLIDAPPILRVAYATTLARLADRALVVIAHGSERSVAEELQDQIELVGLDPVGYVYNLAPLRAEMTVSAGSMADTLGGFPTAPADTATTARRSAKSD